jgi:hypothetical protein
MGLKIEEWAGPPFFIKAGKMSTVNDTAAPARTKVVMSNSDWNLIKLLYFGSKWYLGSPLAWYDIVLIFSSSKLVVSKGEGEPPVPVTPLPSPRRRGRAGSVGSRSRTADTNSKEE